MVLSPSRLTTALLCGVLLTGPLPAAEDTVADEKMLRAIYTAALTTSPVYENLRELTTKFPGRLSGSQNLQGAVLWGQAVLKATGTDRTELQPVMVPHWERGATERVWLGNIPLARWRPDRPRRRAALARRPQDRRREGQDRVL